MCPRGLNQCDEALHEAPMQCGGSDKRRCRSRRIIAGPRHLYHCHPLCQTNLRHSQQALKEEEEAEEEEEEQRQQQRSGGAVERSPKQRREGDEARRRRQGRTRGGAKRNSNIEGIDGRSEQRGEQQKRHPHDNASTTARKGIQWPSESAAAHSRRHEWYSTPWSKGLLEIWSDRGNCGRSEQNLGRVRPYLGQIGPSLVKPSQPFVNSSQHWANPSQTWLLNFDAQAKRAGMCAVIGAAARG